MGVRNLWDILDSCKKTLPLHHLQNKRVCVDLSCWMIQFQAAYRSRESKRARVPLRNLFHRLRALIALNCEVILVADGAIPSIKLSTYRRRLGTSSDIAQEELSHKALRRNKSSEFSRMVKEAKILGTALGIPWLDSTEEAEAQCALLNSSSLCDGCFTSDSDIFLFGARTVYRDIILGDGGGYITCYEMADIETKLGLGRKSLISLALLLGGDYSNGVHGVGPETACRFIKSIGEESVLDHILSRESIITKKGKGRIWSTTDANISEEQASLDNELGSVSKSPFQQVITAYLKPNHHLPESDAVRRACSQHPFSRQHLQQLCKHYFDWSNEKTDQYILPKIAERDLRRFANLRSATSAVGIELSLCEMTISCPVSAVLRGRKVHGSEYYEVSWRNIDGLETSVVPSDLIKRYFRLSPTALQIDDYYI